MSKFVLLVFLFIIHAPFSFAAECDLSNRVYYNYRTASLGVVATLPGPLTRLPGTPEDARADEYGIFSIQAKNNERSQIEIEGLWLGGKYMPIKYAKDSVKRALTQAKTEEEAMKQSRFVEDDAILYRTLSQAEWDKVARDGNYLIMPETAFSREELRAPLTGALIRLKNPGPYFTISSDGRITNRYAIFTNVDVFDRGNWISLDGYRIRHMIP